MVAVSCESSSLTRGSKYSGFDLETLGILENWSLTRGGRNQRFDCIFWVRPGTDMVTILRHFGTFFDEHFLRRLKNTPGGGGNPLYGLYTPKGMVFQPFWS